MEVSLNPEDEQAKLEARRSMGGIAFVIGLVFMVVGAALLALSNAINLPRGFQVIMWFLVIAGGYITVQSFLQVFGAVAAGRSAPAAAPKGHQLRLQGAPEGETVRILSPYESLRIGRDDASQPVGVRKEAFEEYCRLALEGSGWTIKHVTGELPLTVNGEAVAEAVLKPGDAVQVGDLTLLFEQQPADAPAAADQPAEASQAEDAAAGELTTPR